MAPDATDLPEVLHRTDLPCERITRLSYQGHQAAAVGNIHTTRGEPWPSEPDPGALCWYCCHGFSGTMPLPMPIGYCADRDVFLVAGCFCSWACMKAFNFERRHYRRDINALNISHFIHRCRGKPTPVRSAPPRCQLRAFGGHLTIEEFRAASRVEGDDAAPTVPRSRPPVVEAVPMPGEPMSMQPATGSLREPPRTDPVAAKAAVPSGGGAKKKAAKKAPEPPCSASLKIKRAATALPAQFDLLSRSMGLQFNSPQ